MASSARKARLILQASLRGDYDGPVAAGHARPTWFALGRCLVVGADPIVGRRHGGPFTAQASRNAVDVIWRNACGEVSGYG